MKRWRIRIREIDGEIMAERGFFRERTARAYAAFMRSPFYDVQIRHRHSLLWTLVYPMVPPAELAEALKNGKVNVNGALVDRPPGLPARAMSVRGVRSR